MRTHGQLSANGETVTVGAIDAGTKWEDALRGVDTVIHLAARVHVMKDKAADPLTEFLKVNLYGTANLAQQAARAGVKRLVFVELDQGEWRMHCTGIHPLFCPTP